MFLTVGCAHFEDYDGVAFSIQALRLSEPELMGRVEFLVVDNNPDGAHGKAVKQFLSWIPNARYIAAPEAVGTSAPRDRVFREAKGEVVLCMDCHVLLRKGSLRRLLEYYEANPETRDLLSGPMWYDNLQQVSTHFKDEWRGEMWGTWDTDPRGLDADGQPFEIGAMGLGLFSCRKDAWLGFNPEFRGFGGEEWYIHEKVRKSGAKCLCLPWLRWWHRFGRPGGVPYPLTRWHKVRNYVIGHRELGRALTPIYDHFVKTGLLSQNHWEQILAGAVEPDSTKSIVAQDNADCNTCGPKVPESLEKWYEQARTSPSDFNEHVPRLRELATGCDHVVEFGKRRGVSSVAILAGQPKRFTSYDTKTDSQVSGLKNHMGSCEFRFVQGDSLQVDIEECDLLFLDTIGTGQRLYDELKRHSPRCRKRICFHDTEVYGLNGEGGGPGMLAGMRRFLQEHLEWSVMEHHTNNHGFTILSCDPADRKPLPSIWTQGLNFLVATTRRTLNGGTYLPLPMASERMAECAVCDQRSGPNCSKCGCFLWQIADDAPVKAGQPGKVWYPTEFCPLGKWHERPKGGVVMSGEEIKAMMEAQR